jgi:hypothetical protein
MTDIQFRDALRQYKLNHDILLGSQIIRGVVAFYPQTETIARQFASELAPTNQQRILRILINYYEHNSSVARTFDRLNGALKEVELIQPLQDVFLWKDSPAINIHISKAVWRVDDELITYIFDYVTSTHRIDSSRGNDLSELRELLNA